MRVEVRDDCPQGCPQPSYSGYSQRRSPTVRFDNVHRGNTHSAQQRYYRPGYRTNELKLRVPPEEGISGKGAPVSVKP